MITRTWLINHPSELNRLTVMRFVRGTGRGTIQLSREFEHTEKERWEADLNRYYYACGCASGAKGLLLMLVIGCGVAITGYVLGTLSLRQLIVIPIAAAIFGAVIGKIAGLLHAHRLLVRVVHTVQAHWIPKDAKERPIIICG
jgi:hypothetical protein